MGFQQLRKKTLYGWATVVAKNGGVRVILRQKDQEQSTKDTTVWQKSKFDFTTEEFFKFLPPTVKELGDPDRHYMCAMNEDGTKIYQFRPYNADSMVVRLRGFYKNDKGDIVFNQGFKDKEHLTAIFELEVTRGEWTGTVYPYRYWNVTDQKTHEPVFKVVDGNIQFNYITKPMRAILEASGVFERDPKCKLADTDDAQAILDWMEDEILKDKSVRLAISIKEGCPDWDHFEVLDADESGVEDEDDDDDETESTTAPKAPAKSAKKFDEDDED